MKPFPLLGREGKTVLGVIVAALFLLVPSVSADRFELLSTKEITVPAGAVDVAVSPDGNWTFVLTAEGEIAIFDPNDRFIQTMEAGIGYDRLEFDKKGNRLILAGSGKRLKILSLAMSFDFEAGSSPMRGPRDAPVIITVFSDFQCPYCAKLVPLLEEVLMKYPSNVALQFKNYPLRSHRMARSAAMAAMAAEKQNMFWEYHTRIFDNFRKLTDDLLVEIADETGLDVERFQKDRKSVEISNLINRDMQEASRIGVRGTPTVFINGKRQNQRSLEAFSKAIESELTKIKRP